MCHVRYSQFDSSSSGGQRYVSQMRLSRRQILPRKQSRPLRAAQGDQTSEGREELFGALASLQSTLQGEQSSERITFGAFACGFAESSLAPFYDFPLQRRWIPSDSRIQSQDVRPLRHAGGSPVRSWVPAGWPFTYSTSVMVATCSAELVAEHD
jgi:hypothetical protein